MTTDKTTLDRLLDDLAADLPELIESYPDPSDFWIAFARESEIIEGLASSDMAEHVSLRLDEMLSKHGRYIAGVQLGPG